MSLPELAAPASRTPAVRSTPAHQRANPRQIPPQGQHRMHIDPNALPPRDRHQLLIRCVVPRPIGWVSTLSPSGVPNLAPFSYFGAVTSSPPTLMLSVGRRAGQRKDTSANLTATREAVVHIPHRPLAEAMVATGAAVAADVNEFDLAGLTAVPSQVVRPPRVQQAAVALECRLVNQIEVGTGPADVFFLEVVSIFVADSVAKDGLPDPRLLQAVGRLGGDDYCDTPARAIEGRPLTR